MFFLIFVITLIVWHNLLNQSLIGEGYYYFEHSFTQSMNKGSFLLTQYDSFPKLFFEVFGRLFDTHFFIYFLIEFLTLVVIYCLLYWITFKLTKEKLLAFSATIFFLANYAASNEILAIGNYQWFIQRIIVLPLIFYSFYLFSQYLKGDKFTKYVTSIFLFSLTVLMNHFSLFLLPLFLTYPVIKSLAKKGLSMDLVKNTIYALTFLAAGLLLSQGDFYVPQQSFPQFLFSINLIPKVLLQIPAITFPHVIIKALVPIIPYKTSPSGIAPLIFLAFFLLGLYLATFITLIKRKKTDMLILFVSSSLAMLLTIAIFLYVDGRGDVFAGLNEARQYFIPSLFTSINFAFVIWVLFPKSKKRYLSFSLIILVTYVIYNTFLIWQNYNLQTKPKFQATKKYIKHMKSLSTQFKPDTTIVVPLQFAWPSKMIRELYGQPGMQFATSPDTQSAVAMTITDDFGYFPEPTPIPDETDTPMAPSSKQPEKKVKIKSNDSHFYRAKRLMEKIILKAVSPFPDIKVGYYKILLHKRLTELERLTQKQDVARIEDASQRYSATAGQLTEYVIANNLTAKAAQLKELLFSHLPLVEVARDNYPGDTAQWRFVQYDVDYLKTYISKLEE